MLPLGQIPGDILAAAWSMWLIIKLIPVPTASYCQQCLNSPPLS